MNPAFEYIERRKTTLLGGALGIVLFLGFVGQGYREVKRFNVDVNNPETGACLGLTETECIAQVTGSDNSTDRRSLDEQARRAVQANNIGARQRREARQRARQRTSGGSTSPSQPPSSTGGSSSPPTTPTPTRPTPPASGTPSRPPSTTSRPAPTPSQPPSTPPTSPPSAPSPPSSSTPTVPPVPTVPTPPTPTQPRPPINIPVPPIPPILPKPPVICIPGVGGINCPPGSVQPKRTSGKGPGNEDAPIRPGSDPDDYDIDPTQPSDNVNGTPVP